MPLSVVNGSVFYVHFIPMIDTIHLVFKVRSLIMVGNRDNE